MAEGQYNHKEALRSHLDDQRESLVKSVSSCEGYIKKCGVDIVNEEAMIAMYRKNLKEYSAAIRLIDEQLLPAVGGS